MEGKSAPKSSAPLSCPGTQICTKTALEEISSIQGRAENLASGLWLDPMSWTVRKTTPSRFEFRSPWTKVELLKGIQNLIPNLNVDGNVSKLCLYQRVARPRLEFRDRDFYNFSLNIETETETENVKVSMSRPRLQISKLSRPRPIETLIFQSCRDRDSSRL